MDYAREIAEPLVEEIIRLKTKYEGLLPPDIKEGKEMLESTVIEHDNGDREWYIEDKLHREGGLPAVEYVDGYKSWWINGKRHRENGLPAIERSNGDKEWWVNGKPHRENDLPAVERADGDKSWWVNGKRHREGGLPAVEYANGGREWWVDDVRLTEEECCIYDPPMKCGEIDRTVLVYRCRCGQYLASFASQPLSKCPHCGSKERDHIATVDAVEIIIRVMNGEDMGTIIWGNDKEE